LPYIAGLRPSSNCAENTSRRLAPLRHRDEADVRVKTERTEDHGRFETAIKHPLKSGRVPKEFPGEITEPQNKSKFLGIGIKEAPKKP